MGFEPTTTGITIQDSTAELQLPLFVIGLPCKNRTHIKRVEAFCIIHYTKGSYLVEVPGLEPRMTQSKCVVLPLHYTSIETLGQAVLLPFLYTTMVQYCIKSNLVPIRGFEPRPSALQANASTRLA